MVREKKVVARSFQIYIFFGFEFTIYKKVGIKTLPTSTATTFQYSPQNYTYNLMTVSFKNMFSSNYAQLYLHLKYTLYAWVGLIGAPKYQKV